MVTALNQIQGREGENFGMIEDFYYISPSSPASLSSVFSAVACTMDAVRPLTFPVHSLYPLQFLSVYALSLLLNLYRSADFCTYWPDACTMRMYNIISRLQLDFSLRHIVCLSVQDYVTGTRCPTCTNVLPIVVGDAKRLSIQQRRTLPGCQPLEHVYPKWRYLQETVVTYPSF